MISEYLKYAGFGFFAGVGFQLSKMLIEKVISIYRGLMWNVHIRSLKESDCWYDARKNAQCQKK